MISCDAHDAVVLPTGALSADLKERVTSSPNTLVKSIADVLLQRVSRGGRESGGG